MTQPRPPHPADSLQLLPTVLQQLPTLLSKPSLASTVFLAVRKTSTTSSPIITPLLAPLTAVALAASTPSLRQDAIATCLSLTRSLISRRLFPLISAYVTDLVRAAHQLVQHSQSTPLTALLSNFIATASLRATTEQERNSLRALNIPPVPVSPASLEALLYLLASLIPAEQPPQWPHSTPYPPNFPSTIDMTACRLWIAVGAAARAAVFDLASNYVLLSSRCGDLVACAAACVLERACHPVAGVVVPAMTRERVQAVLHDVLVEGDVSEALRGRLYELARLVSRNGCLPSELWAQVGVHEAVRGEGEIGCLLRELSRGGYVDNSCEGEGSALGIRWGGAEPPRKRRKMEGCHAVAVGSIQEAPSQGSEFSGMEEGVTLTPVAALTKELANLETIYICVETGDAMRVLVRVLEITANALKALKREPCRRTLAKWLAFVHSLIEIVRDVCNSIKTEGSADLWLSILELGLACIRLAKLLSGLKKMLIGPSKTPKVLSCDDISTDFQTLCGAIVSVLSFASQAMESDARKLSLITVATLMWELGELMRLRDCFNVTEKRLSEVLKVSGEFRKLALNGSQMKEWTRCTLLKGAIHTETIAFKANKIESFKEVLGELCGIIQQNESESRRLATAALFALTDLLCFQLGCHGNHTCSCDQFGSLDAASVSRLDVKTWTEFFKIVEPIVQGVGMDELIPTATRFLGTLLIHTPRSRIGQVSSALVKAMWHPTSESARREVIYTVTSVLQMHLHYHTDRCHTSVVSQSEELIQCERGDSWDNFETVVTGNEEVESVICLLGVELNCRLERWYEVLNNENIAELEDLDVSPVAMILMLDGDDSASSKIRGLAVNAMLISSSIELKTWRSSFQQRSNSPNESIANSPRTNMNFKMWNCFVKQILMNKSTPHSELVGTIVEGRPKEGGVRDRYPRNIVKGKSPVATIIANFLNHRSQDWLPHALNRMLTSKSFSQQIADLLMLQDVETLWRKVPKHTVGALLRDGDAVALQSLALQVGKSQKELAEQVCADALAQTLFVKQSVHNSGSEGADSLLYEALQMSPEEVVAKREGKIVQRIVMEIGSCKDTRAREALTSLSKFVRTNSRMGPGENVAGVLVSNHFMLVMDAVNRGLFHSKATKRDRVRFVRMLDGVLSLAQSHLHLFVPKILATLKMAIDIDPTDVGFRTMVFAVWRNFLAALGAKRAMPHLGSILSILLPFLSSYNDLLFSVLEEIIAASSRVPCGNRSEILMLLRIVSHRPLQEVLQTWESKACRNFLESQKKNDLDYNSGSDMGKLVQECEDICDIISQHANGVIEVLAASFLLSLLQEHRLVLDKVLQTYSAATLADGNRRPIGAVASLLRRLVSTLNKSKNIDCQEKLLQCIGEVGALDPAVVQRFSKEYSLSEMHAVDIGLSYNCTVQSLVCALLDSYLTPALVRGEQREGCSNHLNRVGLVIQELLRVCGCRRETASRASKTTRVRKPSDSPVDWDQVLVGDTEEENGIFFWENLDATTRTVAQPYLAEPFDVQHYKGVFGGASVGNIQLACQPVWSKVRAATATGVAASAHEWRRQMVVQLADYIGKQGKFGKALKALRPVLRYDDNIATCVFPFLVTDALDLQARNGSKELQEFLVNEISLVLKQCTSPQPVFDVFDILRKWREDRCRTRGSQIYARNQNNRSAASSEIVAGPKRRVAIDLYIQQERRSDTLSPLIDLDGGEMPALCLLVQAKAAFAARSYARTVMLAECFLRNLRISRGFPSWPASIRALRVREVETDDYSSDKEFEAYSLLQKSFAGLEDSDSMAGIAFLRPRSSLPDAIVDAEAAGRHDKALIMYERAIAHTPRAPEMHEGFLQCLMTLGHWETMLSHAEGLLASAKLEDTKLRECSQALGIDAAWRLGRWERVEKLSQTSLEDHEGHGKELKRLCTLDFNISLGKMFLALQSGDVESLELAASEVRIRLLPTISRLAREGYGRAYPAIAQLQILSDVEDAVHVVREELGLQDNASNSARHIHSLISLKGREIATAPSLRVKEPILSARKVCFQQAGRHDQAASVNLRLAELAHDTENLRAASAYAFQASTAPSVDSGTLNEAIVRLAQVAYANGDAAGALLTVKEEIERLLSAKVGEDMKPTFNNHTNSDRLCTAYLLAGHWIEEARSEPSDVILDHFEEATVHGPTRVEPFYALGRHFDMLLQAGANTDTEVAFPKDSRAGRRAAGTPAARSSFLQSSHYVPEVIKSFAKALCNGHRRLFEALPRMLTVWFDYHTAMHCPDSSLSGGPVENSVNREMKKAFKNIPLYMWMTAIPQLMSRLNHPRRIVHDELVQLLARIFATFPDQSSWLILPSTFVQSESRRKAVNSVLKLTTQPNRKLKRRETAGNKAAQDNGGERMRALRAKVGIAHSAIRFFVGVCVTTLPKEKRGQMENCAKEFNELRTILHKIGNLNPIVPTLKTLTVQLPPDGDHEHRPFAREPTTIVDIDNFALVMSSMMRPRRISLIGSDGQHYRFLVKQETSGDMRKDSRLVEFVTVLNRLLFKDSMSWRRDLELKTYAVLPLTEEAGMIEWVNDLDPLRKLVRDQHASLPNIPDTGMIQKRYIAASDKKQFLEWAIAQCPPMLDRFFMQRFGGGTKPEEWLRARNMWTRSVAVWSMAGYIVGLGDRHGENVLIETTTGRCVHVDFAMLFDKGLTLKVPEIVPFRLTPNMVTAMGIAGFEGSFRIICEVAMGIMRRNSDALLGVLETFLHDPLAEWGKSDTRTPNGAILGNKEAWQTRAAVKAKLTGMVDGSGLALSIKGQVERLIHEATSMDNLSKMYIWWSGWI